jgi:hypothetical protein
LHRDYIEPIPSEAEARSLDDVKVAGSVEDDTLPSEVALLDRYASDRDGAFNVVVIFGALDYKRAFFRRKHFDFRRSLPLLRDGGCEPRRDGTYTNNRLPEPPHINVPFDGTTAIILGPGRLRNENPVGVNRRGRRSNFNQEFPYHGKSGGLLG